MSATATATVTTQRTGTPPPPIVLRLRLPEPDAGVVQSPETSQNPPHSVTWDSEVVDNEHMKKRKSKKCCIFHKQRPFYESDSESDDDSDGGWEIDDNGVPVWIPGEGKHGHDHGHSHGNHDCGGCSH